MNEMHKLIAPVSGTYILYTTLSYTVVYVKKKNYIQCLVKVFKTLNFLLLLGFCLLLNHFELLFSPLSTVHSPY